MLYFYSLTIDLKSKKRGQVKKKKKKDTKGWNCEFTEKLALRIS